MRYNWQKFLAGLFIILGAGIVVVATVVQVTQLNRSRDDRSQADETPSVVISWQDFNPKTEKDAHSSMDLFLNSRGWQLAGLELWGTITGVPQSEVRFEPLPVPGLVSVTQEFKAQDNKLLFHWVYFSDISVTNLFTTNNATRPIGRLFFTPAANRTVAVEFDASKSDVASYTTPNLVIQYAGGVKKEFTLEIFEKKGCNESCGTDGECKSEYICYEGKCRKPDMRTDDKCGVKPDLGLQRKCNEYCADSRDCVAGFTCWYNYCRNPRNVENTECRNPAPPRAATGTGGVTRTPKASPSPSPVVATITNIVSKPFASPSPTPTPATKSAQATTSAFRTPTPSVTVSPAPQPSIVPLPENLQPGAQQPTSRWRSIGTIVVILLVVGLVGGLVWWWLQHRVPARPTDY